MNKHKSDTPSYANLETGFVYVGNPDLSIRLPIRPLGYTATDDLWK